MLFGKWCCTCVSLFNDVRDMLSKGACGYLFADWLYSSVSLAPMQDDKGFSTLVTFAKLSLSDKCIEGKVAVGCVTIHVPYTVYMYA